MFDKLLVNLDEQQEHLPMLEKAARLLAPAGHLELFCCAWQAGLDKAPAGDREAQRRFRHAWLTQAETRLEHLAQRIRLPQAEVGTDVALDPHRAEGVIRKCLRYQPDLLLHPLSTRTGLLHHLLAPEDWDLLRDAPVPVLLSRDRPWPERLRIAVALDPVHLKGDPAHLDVQLLTLAHRLAQQLGAELHAVHAFNALPQAAIFDEHQVTDFEQLQVEVKAEHRARMEAILAQYSAEAGAPELDLLQGELHRVLPAFCQQRQIDLLLMGSTSKGFLEQLLVGNRAERVLDRVACDLLVLKPTDFVCPITP